MSDYYARVQKGVVTNIMPQAAVPSDEDVAEACGARADLLQFVPIPPEMAWQVTPGWRWDGTTFQAPVARTAGAPDATDRSAPPVPDWMRR